MLKQLRQATVQHLWQVYCKNTPQVRHITDALKNSHSPEPVLDHFAIIDLPGPHTGIHQLAQIFSAIGFISQGNGYLAEKQNDFLWMTEIDSLNTDAAQVLPQVVVADFRPEEMPAEIRHIIEKYSRQAPASPLPQIQRLAGAAYLGDQQAAHALTNIIHRYFAGRDWPLPSVREFQTVQAFNELLAWVLVFGRKPNHFTFSVHLLPGFNDLSHFHHYVENDLGIELNHEGGTIKGNRETGIAQGSSKGERQILRLADGDISIPTGFVEFVWRYPQENCVNPKLWQDYFTGFVASHADYVIESLYTRK